MMLGRRSRAGVGVVAWGVVGTAIAFAAATGCGDDTSGTGPSGTGADAAADAPNNTEPDATQSDAAQDGSEPDATAHDGSQPDVTQQDVTPPPDAPAIDARQDALGTDARADATDASNATDGTVPGDASDGGSCTTTIAALTSGDGGVAADAALPPKLLFGFDNGRGLDIEWSGYANTAESTALLGQTSTEGHFCPGALEMNVTYTAYGSNNSGALFKYDTIGTGTQDWTGRAKLHFWVKLVTSDYGSISGVIGIVHSNAYTDSAYSTFLSGAVLSTGAWYEAVVALTPGTAFAPALVNAIEFQLQPTTANPDGGVGAPAPTTLLVDDVWLE